MIDLSPQQDRAAQAVSQWLTECVVSSQKRPFLLGGYAGTGKTSLARQLAGDLRRVEFVAYTGRAAYVMRQKGCTSARTIHNLIYRPTGDGAKQASDRLAKAIARRDQLVEELRKLLPGDPKERALSNEIDELERTIAEGLDGAKRPGFVLNTESDARFADLIIVDEASMVGARVGVDLESFGRPILALGDPAQLPPVMDGGYFTNRDPDFLLTEVHRQAAESGILRLATKVRQGAVPYHGDACTDVTILNTRDSDECRAAVMESSQSIVGRNKTRHTLNQRVRQLLGHYEKSPFPVDNDRVVCLRNDHEVGLLNGSLWRVVGDAREAGDVVLMNVLADDVDQASTIPVTAHSAHFLGRGDEIKVFDRRDAQEFDYGYAITCHKAQGGQWPSVCVYDESRAFGSEKHRWLYTAITRAAEKLTVVLP